LGRVLCGGLLLLGPLACESGETTDAPLERSQSAITSNCTTLDQQVQGALNASRPQAGAPDGVVTVRTPACGSRTYKNGTHAIPFNRLWRLGSVTKTYTAALILKLEAQNPPLLHIDDPISNYVSGIPDGDTITLRMLLNHTSGLFEYTHDSYFIVVYTLFPGKVWTPQELVNCSIRNPRYPAGYHYANTNYVLLGMVAETVTGMPLAQAMRTYILTPYGLTNTFLAGSELVNGTMAPSYQAGENGSVYQLPTNMNVSWTWAAGAMVATSADEARWIELLGSGQVLPPTQMAEMQTWIQIPGRPGSFQGLGPGLFDSTMTGNAGPAINHNGGLPGFTGWAVYFTQDQVSVGLTLNQTNANMDLVLRTVSSAIYGGIPLMSGTVDGM